MNSDGIVTITKVKGVYPVGTSIYFKTPNMSLVQKIMKVWGYQESAYQITPSANFDGETTHTILDPPGFMGVGKDV